MNYISVLAGKNKTIFLGHIEQNCSALLLQIALLYMRNQICICLFYVNKPSYTFILQAEMINILFYYFSIQWKVAEK